MNSYKTPHMRTAPQVHRRTFNFPTGRSLFYGTKGANGEWMLEAYFPGNGWEYFGSARKVGVAWKIDHLDETYKTLAAAAVAAYAHAIGEA